MSTKRATWPPVYPVNQLNRSPSHRADMYWSTMNTKLQMQVHLLCSGHELGNLGVLKVNQCRQAICGLWNSLKSFSEITWKTRITSLIIVFPERTLVDFLLCFSLIGNTKKIFATKVPSTAITSINGLRVISMFWVILGHTFLFWMISTTAGWYCIRLTLLVLYTGLLRVSY